MTTVAKDRTIHDDACPAVHGRIACTCQRVTFSDGNYSVAIRQYTVTIAKVGGSEINVPKGHAWYDRVCEASDRRSVEDLYAELAAAVA